ncbi:hypothetical protein J6590_090143, partial [Homalodisca vitripennis]
MTLGSPLDDWPEGVDDYGYGDNYTDPDYPTTPSPAFIDFTSGTLTKKLTINQESIPRIKF